MVVTKRIPSGKVFQGVEAQAWKLKRACRRFTLQVAGAEAMCCEPHTGRPHPKKSNVRTSTVVGRSRSVYVRAKVRASESILCGAAVTSRNGIGGTMVQCYVTHMIAARRLFPVYPALQQASIADGTTTPPARRWLSQLVAADARLRGLRRCRAGWPLCTLWEDKVPITHSTQVPGGGTPERPMRGLFGRG